MQGAGVALAKNISSVAAQPQVSWKGGRCALCIFATTFPSTCQLQMLGKDSATWLTVNSSTYSANQVISYDLPAGQYRLNLSGGSVSGLYADLVAIPYG
jgi:hypothetical protein